MLSTVACIFSSLEVLAVAVYLEQGSTRRCSACCWRSQHPCPHSNGRVFPFPTVGYTAYPFQGWPVILLSKKGNTKWKTWGFISLVFRWKGMNWMKMLPLGVLFWQFFHGRGKGEVWASKVNLSMNLITWKDNFHDNNSLKMNSYNEHLQI